MDTNLPKETGSSVAADSTPSKPHFSARLARQVYAAYKNGSWKRSGERKAHVWAKKTYGIKPRTFYKMMKIIEYCGCFSDEKINRLGPEKCYILACRVEENGLDPSIEDLFNKPEISDKMTVKQLRRSPRKVSKPAKEPACGEALEPSFRGLMYAPINEQGVVFLFGMVCYDLKFRVESVQQPNPDCTAKRKIKDGKKSVKWQTVHIDFKYRSKKFSPDDSPNVDLIVCWVDDLPASKRTSYPEVLELKSAIKELSHTLPSGSAAGEGRSSP